MSQPMGRGPLRGGHRKRFWAFGVRARAAQLVPRHEWHHARYQAGEVVALVRRCRRAAATLAYTRKARDSADTYGPRARGAGCG